MPEKFSLTPGEGAEESSKAAEVAAEEIGIHQSIFDRLKSRSGPPEHVQKSLDGFAGRMEKIRKIAKDSSRSPDERYDLFEETLTGLRSEFGDNNANELNGHFILNQFEKIINEEEVKEMRSGMARHLNNMPTQEQADTLEMVLTRGLVLPHDSAGIADLNGNHPFFYIEKRTGLVQNRADLIQDAIMKLSTDPEQNPPNPPINDPATKALVDAVVGKLEALRDCNPGTYLTQINDVQQKEMPRELRDAVGSIQTIVGSILLVFTAVSIFRKSWLTIPYGLLTILAFNPRFFAGELETARTELKFIHERDYHRIAGENREHMTGKKGEKLMKQLSDSPEASSGYARLLNKDTKEDGTLYTTDDYFADLEKSKEVSAEGVKFLKDLYAKNSTDADFLIKNVTKVARPGSQDLLAGFSREGFDLTTLGEIEGIAEAVKAPDPPELRSPSGFPVSFGKLG